MLDLRVDKSRLEASCRQPFTLGDNKICYFFLNGIYYSSVLNILLDGLEYVPYFLIGLFSVYLFWKRFTLASKTDLLLFGFIALLSFNGYLNNNFHSYWLTDNVFFLLASTVLFYKSRTALVESYSKLPNLVAKWLIFGTILSWYIIVKVGLQPSEIGVRIVRDGAETGVASFDILAPLYPALFIAPFYKYIAGYKKYSVIAAIITFFVFSFFTATRGGILVSVISLSVIFIPFGSSVVKKSKRFSLAILIFLAAVFLFAHYSADRLMKAYDNVVFRFFEAENFYSGRDIEEQLLQKSFTSEEWTIGRGFGGANHSWIWSRLKNGLNIVHKGYLFLILKGGVLFLLLIYGIALVALVKLIRRGKAYYPFAFCILLFLFLDQMHTQWLNLFPCLFFWLSISMGLNKYHISYR